MVKVEVELSLCWEMQQFVRLQWLYCDGFAQGIAEQRSRGTPAGWRNSPVEAFPSCWRMHGVIFDKKVTWRLHIEMIEAKAFRTFIRIYSCGNHHALSNGPINTFPQQLGYPCCSANDTRSHGNSATVQWHETMNTLHRCLLHSTPTD
jgi:hypothetical protein